MGTQASGDKLKQRLKYSIGPKWVFEELDDVYLILYGLIQLLKGNLSTSEKLALQVEIENSLNWLKAYIDTLNTYRTGIDNLQTDVDLYQHYQNFITDIKRIIAQKPDLSGLKALLRV